MAHESKVPPALQSMKISRRSSSRGFADLVRRRLETNAPPPGRKRKADKVDAVPLRNVSARLFNAGRSLCARIPEEQPELAEFRGESASEKGELGATNLNSGKTAIEESRFPLAASDAVDKYPLEASANSNAEGPKRAVDRGADADAKAHNRKELGKGGSEFGATAMPDGKEHEVERLLDHRVQADYRVELLVKWAGEPEENSSFELEEEIQKGAAETLYEYWKQQGGRTDAVFHSGESPSQEAYHVFDILRHEKQQRGVFQLQVQWVGYPETADHTTFEPEAKLRRIAPGLLDEYWRKHGGREQYLVQCRRGKERRNY